MHAQWIGCSCVCFFSSIEENRNHGVTAAQWTFLIFKKNNTRVRRDENIRRRKRKDIIIVIVINKTATLQMPDQKLLVEKCCKKNDKEANKKQKGSLRFRGHTNGYSHVHRAIAFVTHLTIIRMQFDASFALRSTHVSHLRDCTLLRPIQWNRQ